MSKFSYENLPSYYTIITTLSTITATTLVVKTLVPSSLSKTLKNFANRFSTQLTVVIEESDGLTPNNLFHAANIFLSTKISPSTRRIKASNLEKDENVMITVDKNEEIVDMFEKVKLVWVLCSKSESNHDGHASKEIKFFELSFSKKYKDLVVKRYLPYVLKRSREIKEVNKVLKLHTVDYNGTDYWGSVVLNHPATFDTMAMEGDKKREIIRDLDAFVSKKEYYRRVGRAWKRGYLLYGPPGTGKTSLVAAMANYLKFDVYDLDLKEVQCNSDLRRLLIGSGNKSILVIEDIDCNVGIVNRDGEDGTQPAEDDKITLSALLNFIDGLWSSCGDEKIIIFTTNHKDRLDEALLRPGRMDMHIHMSHCTFDGFKTLAYNYLRIEDHSLFRSVEELLAETKVTPAEIAGELMKNENAVVALGNVIKLLEGKALSTRYKW